ncbi:MAG: hypothetical protein KF724_01395 [Phycisphaeraceae bacterium]|nr:hypothetical protein [Phycisphaeraceae bacterium]
MPAPPAQVTAPDDPGVWATPVDRSIRKKLRLAGAITGGLLVLAAFAVVLTRGNEFGRALSALASPSPAALGALLAAVVGTTMLTTIAMLVLIRRFGRVEFGEMFRLVCASTLGNFLPLQPGLAGRVAYHHLVNRIKVQQSVLSIAEATMVSLTAVVMLAGSLWLVHRQMRFTGSEAHAWWLPLLAGLLALPLLPWPSLRPFAFALLARWLDLLLWALRAWACFALVGQEISPSTALAFACVAMLANLVPFIGNGLGIREWAVGLLATPLAGVSVEAGLAAELVGRAAELIFFVPAGLVASRGIIRRLRSALAERMQAQSAAARIARESHGAG